jgi:hypothetical protein
MIFFTVFLFVVKCFSCILFANLSASFALFNDILITYKNKKIKEIPVSRDTCTLQIAKDEQ